MYFWITLLLLLIDWVVFSGLFALFHLGLGFFYSLLVAWTTNDLPFKKKDSSLSSTLTPVTITNRKMHWVNSVRPQGNKGTQRCCHLRYGGSPVRYLPLLERLRIQE